MQKDLPDSRMTVNVRELPYLVELILLDGSRRLYELIPSAGKRGMTLIGVRKQIARRMRPADPPR